MRCAAMWSVLLVGCSLEPKYERPTAPIPESFPATSRAATAGPTAWPRLFLDERLRHVVERALANNRDLRVAAAGILSARAEYALARANILPTVSLSAGAALGGNLKREVTQDYSLELGTTNFEIDLFGRLRSLSHAALEQYLASEAGARAVRLTLIADVAEAWLNIAAQRSLLSIAEQTEISANESVSVTRSRLEGGVASELDVRQAETILAQARSDVASYTTSLAQARNALTLLVGAELIASDLPDELGDSASVLAEMPAGIASSVLLERPDVQMAEHTLKAANANIGAARAAFFPTISLTALGGFASSALASLFSSHGAGWQLSPFAALPIFTGGANEAQLQYSKAQRQLFVADYERVVQRAFREVADALARRQTIEDQLAAQQQLMAAAEASYRLSDARYRAGADTYLNALDAQRTLYAARRTYVITELGRSENLVTLYRVLGGG
ncbi:MAG TPA: efflux transporter outer membrane subunit [Polyangiales bacterium]|nr:efflux transporter outer membrane subunit [Polyangiales bacterium]